MKTKFLKRFSAFAGAAAIALTMTEIPTASDHFKTSAISSVPSIIDYDLNGDGFVSTDEELSTYAVYTAEQLSWFAQYANNHQNDVLNVALMDDIILNKYVVSVDGKTLNPDGEFENTFRIQNFKGVFDGQNYTISGIYYSDSSYRYGIFDTNQGTIKNLRIEDSYIQAASGGFICNANNGIIDNCVVNSCAFYGATDVGGIAAILTGENATISNCSFNGYISSPSSHAGGIVANISTATNEKNVYYVKGVNVKNCFSSGAIVSHATYAGGICGYAGGGVIENCGSSMDVSGYEEVGGVIGMYSSSMNKESYMKNCWFNGSVKGGKYAGGLCGGLSMPYSIVDKCYAFGTVSSDKGFDFMGGLCGSVDSNAEISNSYFNSDKISAKLIGKNAYLEENIVKPVNCDGISTYSLKSGQLCDDENETHSYIDGKCIKCGQFAPDAAIHNSGYSLTVDGTLGLNMYNLLNDSILNDDTAYVEFKVPNGNKIETQKVYVKDVKNSPVKIDDKDNYIFTCYVAAKEIESTIKAKLVYSNGKKSSNEYTITIADYAKKLVKTQMDYSDFVNSMLLYGRYASAYFGDDEYNESGYTSTTASQTASQIKASKGIKDKAYYGTSLILEENIILRHYFTENVTGDMTLSDNGYYYVEEAFNPLQLNGKIDGYDYAVNDYVRNVLINNSNNESLKNLCVALYEYGTQAQNLYKK